jgi:hypothetical protein
MLRGIPLNCGDSLASSESAAIGTSNKHIFIFKMQLVDSAVQVDYFPVGTGKRFVQRTIWRAGLQQPMTSFRTVTKAEAMYDAQQRINNGSTVVDFNLEEYAGSDYTPMSC